jgi:ATP-dependent DNA ligase
MASVSPCSREKYSRVAPAAVNGLPLRLAASHMRSIMDSLNTSIAERPAHAALRFIALQIPTLVTEPPAGAGWVHEIKHDGYRTALLIDKGQARAFTRRGHEWSEAYVPLCAAAGALPCRSAIIDGEVVVQDGQGRSDFALLRRAIRQEPQRLVFIAFDLLHRNGCDLRQLPLIERKQALDSLLAGAEGPRAGGANGYGAPGRVCLAMGGDLIDCREDRLQG